MEEDARESADGERALALVSGAEDAIRTSRIKTQKQLTLPRDIDESLVYRDEVVREIVKTEKQYVRDLHILIRVFLLPLQLAAEEPNGMLSTDDVHKIFANTEILVKVNEELLSGIERRAEEWDYGSCIGDIILQLASFFKLYTVYCKNYGTALETLQKLKNDPRFVRFLAETENHPEVNHLEITSFLILPIQRIPRYVLLLKDLQRHTPKKHPDFGNISKALDLFQDVAIHVNRSIQLADEMKIMVDLQQKFLGRYEVVKPSRRFIRQGTLQKITSRFVKECIFILFNDVLIYAYQIMGSYTFKGEIPLGTSWVRNLDDTEVVQNAFQIVSTKKTYTVYAKTSPEKEGWMSDINGCISVLVQKRPSLIEQRASVNVRKSSLAWLTQSIGLTFTPQQFDPTGRASSPRPSTSGREFEATQAMTEKMPLVHSDHRAEPVPADCWCGCILS